MSQNFSIDDQLKKAKNFIIKGHYQDAKFCYEKILFKYPKNIRAIEGLKKIEKNNIKTDDFFQSSVKKLINLFNSSSHEECITFGKELSLKYPNEVIIPNILGATFAAIDKDSESLMQYKYALEIDPRNPQVYNNLGLTYKKIGDYKKATESFKTSLSIKPNFPEACNNLALSLKEEMKVDDAINYLNKAIEFKPNYSEAFYNLGNTLTVKGDFRKAINAFKKAIELKPDYFDALNNLGATYNLYKDYSNALKSISKALKIRPNIADAYNNLGTAELNLENESEAIKSYNKAIKIDPKFVLAYSNLCGLYERSNQLEKLKETLNKAENQGLSGNEEIKFRRGQLNSRNKDYKNSTLYLEEVDDTKISNKMKIDKYELLGKDYDKIKHYKKAFNCFKKSNSLVSLSVESQLYNPKNYQNEVSQLIISYSKIKKLEWENKIENKIISPVFLVGFPRSGTTLLDNILSSHPNISTLEEKPMIAMVKKSLNKLASYENLKKLNLHDLQNLQKIYLDELTKYLPNENLVGKVFIDKLPLSIIDISLILRIFPKAKFILAIRHPLDCILSCFMQTFNLNDAMANFLNLKNTAELYNKSMKLFDIYESIFKLDFHLIKYENLIFSLKDETTKLLNFLDLNWEKEVDNYRSNALDKKINTPSYNQVTEKIYTRASGRWKNYKNEMHDIMPIMQFWIEKWGY
ncbi:MAG: tetratricopeptide repeat-containing sulfotransferase family protein [Candidatus Puniceispirillales bacterium]